MISPELPMVDTLGYGRLGVSFVDRLLLVAVGELAELPVGFRQMQAATLSPPKAV